MTATAIIEFETGQSLAKQICTNMNLMPCIMKHGG